MDIGFVSSLVGPGRVDRCGEVCALRTQSGRGFRACRRRSELARLEMVSGSSVTAEPTPLADLPMMEYISSEGLMPDPEVVGKIGVYAIYNAEKTLVFMGKSRDIHNSLKMHLTRMPKECYYFKVFQFAKPSRKLFDDMIECWTKECGLPEGNANPELKHRWEHAIDVKTWEYTEEEQADLDRADPGTEFKILKKISRRIEGYVMAELKERGVKEPLRFDPKLKEKGLLDLQSVKKSAPEKI